MKKSLIIEKMDEIFEDLKFKKDDRNDLQKGAPNYKDYVSVVTSIIYKSQNSDLRYRILIEYNLKNGEENKMALFIMKNPSKADKNKSDNTVNRVLETVNYLQYSKVYIMNLVPEYSPNPYDIHEECLKEKILNMHDKLIESISDEVTCVFVAWGSNKAGNTELNTFYNKRIESVKKAIKNNKICCQRYNKDGEPTHPGRKRWWDTKKKEEDYLPFVIKNKDLKSGLH